MYSSNHIKGMHGPRTDCSKDGVFYFRGGEEAITTNYGELTRIYFGLQDSEKMISDSEFYILLNYIGNIENRLERMWHKKTKSLSSQIGSH